jgi:hypothetical protein
MKEDVDTDKQKHLIGFENRCALFECLVANRDSTSSGSGKYGPGRKARTRDHWSQFSFHCLRAPPSHSLRAIFVGGRNPLLPLSFRAGSHLRLSDSPEIGPGEVTNDPSSTSTSHSNPTAFSTINSRDSSQHTPSAPPSGACPHSGGNGSNRIRPPLWAAF